jgi:hypothetical protein
VDRTSTTDAPPASGTAEPSDSARPTGETVAAPGGQDDGSGPSPSGSTGQGVPTSLASIEFEGQLLDLSGAAVDLMGGIETWAVPAATIAGPGLLLLLWLALQACGAMAWLPAARRLRRQSSLGHGRRRT